MTLISWCLLAGIAGEPVISTMISKFIGTIEESSSARQTKGNSDSGEHKSNLKIISNELPNGIVGRQYDAVLKVEGGSGALKWDVKPSLPKGMAFDTVSGKISGIPESALETKLTFSVSDSSSPNSKSDSKDIVLKINEPKLRIITEALQDGSVGKDYSDILKADGSNGPLKWTITPALPDGITFDSTSGKISGKPQSASETKLKVTVSDNRTPSAQSDTREIILKITA